MNLTLDHKGGLSFIAHNQKGISVDLNASPNLGETGNGFRPMELFLISLASCTSIDTVLILNKTGKPYRDYRVAVEGKRREKIPQFFTEIALTFSLTSEEIPLDIFYRAVMLSLTKYCSVAEMIRSEVKISARVKLNGKLYDKVIEKVSP